jgi:E3 ubiquitin-protein ligase RNF216
MDDNVIEVSSSSSAESSPTKTANAKAQRSKRLSRNPGRFNDDQVIELTDSETEENDAFVLRKRSSGRINLGLKVAPVAGPSRPRPRPTLSSVSPQASSSKLSQKASTSAAPKPLSPQKTPLGPVPLFLPEDEGENDFAQPNAELLADAGPTTIPKGQPAMDAVPPAPPEPTPPVQPPPEVDPIDTYVAKVLEIIPDVQVDYLLGLIVQHLPSSQERVVETVLYHLFENPTFPKVERKGKRKRDEDAGAEATASTSKPGVDYANKEREFRGSPQYLELALVSLFRPTPQSDYRSLVESRNISF